MILDWRTVYLSNPTALITLLKTCLGITKFRKNVAISIQTGNRGDALHINKTKHGPDVSVQARGYVQWGQKARRDLLEQHRNIRLLVAVRAVENDKVYVRRQMCVDFPIKGGAKEANLNRQKKMEQPTNQIAPILEKVRKVWEMLNESRFGLICNMAGKQYTPYELRKEYAELQRIGMVWFLQRAEQAMLDAFLQYSEIIDTWRKQSFSIEIDKHWRKYIYQKGEEILTQEVDISTYEGLKIATIIHESASAILGILPLCDRVQNGENYINVYEHDLIKYSDKFGEGSGLVLAKMDKSYIGGDAYYLELLFNEKYGYLNSQGKPFLDSKPSRFDESIFNAKPNRYNYHVFTMCKEFKVIGNLVTDSHLLMPDKK